MHIGEAAKRSGVPAKTIRYYETIGLIAPTRRTAAGYRIYDDQAVHTLQFIQRARSLGFPVKQVGELLGLWRDRDRKSADVKALARAQIEEIDRRIAELREMRGTLEHLAARCHGDERPECPILADLAGESAGGDDGDRAEPAGARHHDPAVS
ncbi:MerR family transcriptional regulator, copper efflux regulator [Limimonas halophila]|uniref:MerR family transcriptional regulator, copper efflux regulator n=1 Tax=Limimonas halophila TaxID=1082479 RepID=A0A1G7NAT3_9PROT|nr:Cu(I)-responsive transcriptional regulator [Limimonas halophila]SDF71066.1 MerR family transcriptional regulator, copper efflux regulator [Limimonas halophila]